MAEPAQKNSNSSRDAQCAAGGFCTALSVVFRPLVWLIKGLLSVLAAVSHVRDFLVFVAQVSSLPVRMAVYCGTKTGTGSGYLMMPQAMRAPPPPSLAGWSW